MIAQATPTIPQALEAEAALLGSCILDSTLVMPDIVGDIDSDDFYKVQHRVIYAALLELHAAGVKVDMVVLHQHLRDKGELDGIGGVDYLLSLAEAVPTVESASHYAKIVKDKSIQRQRVTAAEKLLERVKVGDVDELDALLEGVRVNRTGGKNFLTISELDESAGEPAEPVIDGLLRRGEVCSLVSASKGRKSWAMLHLAMSVAARGDRRPDWVGLNVPPGKSLLIDCELTPATIRTRARLVMAELGINLHDLGDRLHVWPMRGRLFDVDCMLDRAEDIRRQNYNVVILDPIYKTYPRDFDENSNADMAALFGRFQHFSACTGAALVVTHHLGKGPSDRRVIDSGAGAGAMARSVDCHCIIRPDEADPNRASLEAVVRSFKPLPKIPLRTRGVVWVRDDAVVIDTTPWTPERFAKEIVGSTPKRSGSIDTAAAAAGINPTQARRLKAAAEDEGYLASTKEGTSVRYHYTGKGG